MKKFIYVLLFLIVVSAVIKYSYAEDNFIIKQNVIKNEEEEYSIDIVAPYFEGFNNSDKINLKIKNIIVDFIGDAKSASRSLEEYKKEMIANGEVPINSNVTLNTTYDYVKNGEILSIQLNTYYYAGGAHGTSIINSITTNTVTGEIYVFKNLFKENSNFNEVITDLIIKAIDSNPDGYFDDYAQTIMDKNGEYDFYIDGDKLVIYFGIYDIVPFAGGIPRFVIDSSVIKDLLKDEVYRSISKGNERGLISINGKDIGNPNKILFQDYVPLLPLRDTAEALGYEVDWNKKDGAIIAGGYIKEGVDSYWTTDKKPVSITAPVIENNKVFVPLQYFTDVLEENVSLGSMQHTYISNSDFNRIEKIIIRAYNNDNLNENFNNLIPYLEFPTSEIDAINIYADAVKNRNGAIQYGLLSDELRDQYYDYFKESSFVTGVSSPWIDTYEINKIEENFYQITFNLKTSEPSDVTSTTITNVKVIEDGLFWKIGFLEEIQD